MLTVRLRGGEEVVAKLYKGEPSALTYANRAQAEKAADRFGAGWQVIHRGRPWFVAKTPECMCGATDYVCAPGDDGLMRNSCCGCH